MVYQVSVYNSFSKVVNMMKDSIRLLLVISALTLICACSAPKDDPIFFTSKRPAAEAEPPVKDVPADLLATQRAFSQVSKKVTPCVVNISTISRKKLVRPFPDMPPLFEEFFGGSQTRRDRSLGSGFIISRDGYIVTNNHVIREAESIRVKLSNDKVYDARVVGGDSKTDIAVIKIDAVDLPVVVLGDSDRLEVGQWAIAIGNPFGLERSMTVGVISATGRSNVGIETIENFIQTDASINPGNSGGPLLNIHGEVVGINTAIVAAGQGIGFAIPTNMARPIIAQLVEKGKVTRAWLGVSIKPVTEETARSSGLSKPTGALIAGVQQGGPADKGGLRAGDVLLTFGGNEVRDPSHLQQLVATTRVAIAVEVVVLRKGSKTKLSVKTGNAESAASSEPIEEEQPRR
jgi:Do/DeqQ family serine protease